MFKIFRKPAEEDERERAVALYDKVVSLTTDTHEARSMRLRVGMLCKAHLDKTFVAGAQQTEAFEVASALAVTQGKNRPEPPVAPLFQTINSSSGSVCVYIPKEFAEEAFAIGALYQKTELTAEQAIEAMQRLADRISFDALKLNSPFVALQFLRDELAAQSGEAGEGEGEGPQDGADGPPGRG